MKIQAEEPVIIVLTILIGIAFVTLSKKIDKLDPLQKPKGIVLPVLLGVQNVYKSVKDNVGEKHADAYVPYIITLWVFIFLSNIISLFGFSSPTSTLSVTLTLSIMTWFMIQYVELKYGGIKAYFHSFLEPIPVMLPMNIIGKFSTMVSMSLRLFGNILCGGIMMQLVDSACQKLSDSIVGFFTNSNIEVFNFMSPILSPLLHAYFDVFSGFIQTLVFVTLTTVLIGNDIPEEEKIKVRAIEEA